MASSRGGSKIIQLSAETIEKLSFSASSKAHKEKYYLLEKNNKSNPPEVIISFPVSGAFKDWYSKTTFGETKIDLTLFPSLRSIGYDEPALVNQFFLQRFQEILEKSQLRNEVDTAMKKQRQIVFAGHSSGGPVATLATLWAMETYLTPKSRGGIHPLCVTFGSPLIGNHIFSHATRRENWSDYFYHFVMRYDIVPRILFAPLSSVDKRFDIVSQLIDDPKNKSFMSESSLGRIASISDFYFEVMSNAATVTRHAACRLMGTTEATLETLANFVPLSPYRPFGTYIFCTTSGNEAKQIVMKNPDAILQVMFFSAQLSSEQETKEVSNKSLRQHIISYGTELGKNLKLNVGYFQLENLPLSEHTTSGGDIATINTTLNDLGLSTRARLCIQAAAALEERKRNNEQSMKKKISDVEDRMTALEKYRELRGHQKKGYYDAFKDQLETDDFQANVKRLELAGVWDEISEKLLNYELPEEFEGKEYWIDIGTKFRRLVEPLDIANYYRHSRNRDGRVYMAKGGRPKRYRYTQRWLEHAEKRDEGGYSESCFWAEVEDLCHDTDKPFDDVKEKVEALEGYISKWHEKGEVDKDVFLVNSTFAKWWKTLPTHHKEQSCIRSLVEV